MAVTYDPAEICRSVDLVGLVSRYRELVKQGSEYVTNCVDHSPDNNPSMTVSPEKGFVHCFSCGFHADAVAFVMHMEHCTFPQACAKLTNGGTNALPPVLVQPQRSLVKAPPWRSIPAPDDTLPDMAIGKLGQPSATWRYSTADGGTWGYVARYDTADGKEIRCWSWGNYSDAEAPHWAAKHFAAPRPLFHLDELTARPTAQVLVVEGEKTAEAAALLFPGMVVTCWPGGASAAQYVDWSPLKGRDVICCPDNDEPGRKAMLAISRLIKGAQRIRGINTETYEQDGATVDALEGHDLADVVDWTPEFATSWAKARLFTYPAQQDEQADAAAESFHNTEQHVIDDIPLEAYTEADTRQARPTAQHKGNGEAPPAPANAAIFDSVPVSSIVTAASLGIISRRGSQIPMRPVDWLWKGKLAAGKVSMIQGDPGLGKSMLTASLSAVITTGGLWPVTRDKAPLGSVIILSAEDDADDTIMPRLEAAGADLDRIYILDAIKTVDDSGSHTTRGFDLSQDITRLIVLMREVGAKLVIIDPASAYMGAGGKLDSHKNSDVRGIMAALKDAAADVGAAILIVNHLNKSATQSALMRGQGSVGWTAASRAVFGVAKDKDDETGRRRFFLTLKNNLGADGADTNLAYSIETYQLPASDPVIVTSRILWEAAPVTQSVEELFRQPVEHPEQGAMADARVWLQEALANGPARVFDLQVDARKSGHYWSTVRQCKTALGVVTRRIGGAGSGGASEWLLPDNKPARTYSNKDD